jgi:hypothetical protein
MAYKINRSDEHIVLPDGNATVRDIKKYFKQMGGSEFYELESAEVIECWLDEEDLPLVKNTDRPDWSKYGWIKVRMSVSNSGLDDTVSIRPLDTNIKEYPYPGEHVIIASYYGEKYYTQKLNISDSVNINSLTGLSKAYDIWTDEIYKENLPRVMDERVRQIDAEEGDITFNGRFGNSIRLGSNVKEIKTEDGTKEDTGKENSPNIIIRAGQGVEELILSKPVKEDIDLDGSSVWMTTDQKINIKLDNAHSTFIGPERGPDGFGGNRITINSDGLIFNSKKNNILMTSMGFIGVSANTEIALEVPNDTGKVYLGDGLADEPALGGDATMDLLEKLITALETFATTIRGAKGTVVDFIVPLSDIIEGASGLQGSLGKLKKRLNEPKSKTVRVGHMTGPT